MKRFKTRITIILLLVLATAVGAGLQAQQKVCHYCQGKKICVYCKGSGHSQPVYVAGRVMTSPCFSCWGSGKCCICKGTGQYTPVPPSSNSHGRTSSSGQSSGQSNRTCNNCHGIGYEKYPMFENDPSGAMASGSMSRMYVNGRNHSCKVCGRTTYHCHIPCMECSTK